VMQWGQWARTGTESPPRVAWQFPRGKHGIWAIALPVYTQRAAIARFPNGECESGLGPGGRSVTRATEIGKSRALPSMISSDCQAVVAPWQDQAPARDRAGGTPIPRSLGPWARARACEDKVLKRETKGPSPKNLVLMVWTLDPDCPDPCFLLDPKTSRGPEGSRSEIRGTNGSGWQPVAYLRAVAKFCTPGHFADRKRLEIGTLGLRSRRTLWLLFCTPALIVQDGKAPL
jgi:hypothetical protein